MSRLPDFLIIGSMKSGTTTLHAYLSMHTGIFMCEPKEPRFFSLDENYAKGLTWYQGLFAKARDDQVTGEASTCYSRWPRHPNVPERIKKHLPNVRLIYIMRDPVERAYSHYKHRMEERIREGLDIVPFHRAIEDDAEILETGLYARQLERYLAQFDRSRLSLLTLEEFLLSPARHLNELFEFICAGEYEIGATVNRLNRSGTKVAKRAITNALRQARQSALLRPVFDKVPRRWRQRAFLSLRSAILKSPIERAIARRFQDRIQPYNTDDRRAMLEYYRQPNLELADLLQRKLDIWSS